MHELAQAQAEIIDSVRLIGLQPPSELPLENPKLLSMSGRKATSMVDGVVMTREGLLKWREHRQKKGDEYADGYYFSEALYSNIYACLCVVCERNPDRLGRSIINSRDKEQVQLAYSKQSLHFPLTEHERELIQQRVSNHILVVVRDFDPSEGSGQHGYDSLYCTSVRSIAPERIAHIYVPSAVYKRCEGKMLIDSESDRLAVIRDELVRQVAYPFNMGSGTTSQHSYNWLTVPNYEQPLTRILEESPTIFVHAVRLPTIEDLS